MMDLLLAVFLFKVLPAVLIFVVVGVIWQALMGPQPEDQPERRRDGR